MGILLPVILALLGTTLGSFLNVCIDRLPAGKSLVYPPSHCDSCQQRLSARDLVPVFSYLWLRGRCRNCGMPIPRRVLVVELFSGLLLTLSYWHYGLTVEFAVFTFYAYLFLLIFFIDLEHQLILNKVVYPTAFVALIINTLTPQPGLLNGLIGGAIGLVILLIPALVHPDGMGWGDVKMAALIGLVTGFALVFVALFLGVILGGLVAGGLLFLKVRKRKDAIPFGPFMAVAAVVTLLWGQGIMDWYLGRF